MYLFQVNVRDHAETRRYTSDIRQATFLSCFSTISVHLKLLEAGLLCLPEQDMLSDMLSLPTDNLSCPSRIDKVVNGPSPDGRACRTADLS